jgi:hypothetical protein
MMDCFIYHSPSTHRLYPMLSTRKKYQGSRPARKVLALTKTSCLGVRDDPDNWFSAACVQNFGLLAFDEPYGRSHRLSTKSIDVLEAGPRGGGHQGTEKSKKKSLCRWSLRHGPHRSAEHDYREYSDLSCAGSLSFADVLDETALTLCDSA